MEVRHYEDGDAAACAAVYFRSVNEGAGRHYTAEQRHAWAPEVPEAETFGRRLSDAKTVVAQRDGTIVGFMSVTSDCHIDRAFVLPEEMGKGTADALYSMVLNHAACLGCETLTTDASHLARPFFARDGWIAEAEEEIVRNGVTLSRTAMSLTCKS